MNRPIQDPHLSHMTCELSSREARRSGLADAILASFSVGYRLMLTTAPLAS
jgi:hypothetical protein